MITSPELAGQCRFTMLGDEEYDGALEGGNVQNRITMLRSA